MFFAGFVLTGNLCYFTGLDQHIPEEKNVSSLSDILAVILFEQCSKNKTNSKKKRRERERERLCVCVQDKEGSMVLLAEL